MKALSIIFASLLLVTSCAQDRINGNGTITKETRTVSSNFNEIASSGSFDVVVKNGPQDGKIILEGESNVLDVIEVETKGDLLKVQYKSGVSVRTTKRVKVYVNAQNLKGLSMSGSGSIIAEGLQKADSFKIALTGSGDIKANVEADNTKIAISGSGDIDLKGNSNSLDISISGSGDIKAFDMISKSVKVTLSGSGDVKVHALDEIEVKSSGSGDILYKGNPDKVRTKISGSGKFKNV